MLKWVGGLFLSMGWLLILLIILFFVLDFIKNKGQGNFFGTIASWAESHAQPGM